MPESKKEAKKAIDLLIHGGWLISPGEEKEIIPDGAVAIDRDAIFDLGAEKDLKERFNPQESIDAKGGIILPGLINTHTHAAMTVFRGLADDLSLMEWLYDRIFPAEKENVDEDLVYWGTLLACAEMIKSGTTTFADGYFFADEAGKAAKRAGMRMILAKGIIEFPTPDVKDPRKNIEYAERSILNWQGDPLITPAVFCHSAYICRPETIKRAKRLSEKYSLIYIIHLSETEEEVRRIKERYGKPPVLHLENLGILDENLLAAHCVCLDENEVEKLAEYKVKVSHNPESNMKLGCGVAPIPKLLKKGVLVGLGTDGCASNNNLDMFQAMDCAAKLHKVFQMDPSVMKAKTLVKMATIIGAEVLGLGNQIGTLEKGKKADLIVVDTNQPHLVPLYDPCSHLVYAAEGADVKVTVINGRVVMRDGKLLTIDEEETLTEVRRIGEKIKASLHLN
jgi:5-methylthioadenosine/S-adenosylhomocysteine deaminase